jgi:hypothetical protein
MTSIITHLKYDRTVTIRVDFGTSTLAEVLCRRISLAGLRQCNSLEQDCAVVNRSSNLLSDASAIAANVKWTPSDSS